MSKVTDEMLMALADGELDLETSLEVSRAVESNPDLARRLDDLNRTRALAKQAFADVLEMPVPPRLIAAVGHQSGRAPWRNRLGWGFAGAVVAAAAAGLIVVWAGPGGRAEPAPFAMGSDIAAALDGTLSGESVPLGAGGSVEPSATYVTADGVCRSFRVTGRPPNQGWLAVACRDDGSWRVGIAAADGGAGGGFIPASDVATSSVDAFLDAVGAGESLDVPEETRLRDNAWSE